MDDPALFDPKKFPKPEEQPADIVEPVEETVAESQPEQPEEAKADSSRDNASQVESIQQKNFKALRDRMSQTERERDMAMQRLAEIERAKQQPQEEPEDDMQIGPDEIAEGKHISKVVKKMRRMEQELQQYKQQSAASIAETRLRTKYPDFDSVVTKENIDTLRLIHPEIAETINSNPDLYTKAAAAYTMIKQLNVGQPDTFEADRERVQKNAAKPRPINSVATQGASPLAKADAFANGLTEEVKAQLLKEMNECKKNY
jgi:hypothetical protein